MARSDSPHIGPGVRLGVGTLDLFHDEDVEYALRLHGFGLMFAKADVSRQFWRLQAQALNGALAVAL